MRWEAQPTLSAEGQRALDGYARALQQIEDLSVVTIRHSPSDLLQFMVWCACRWRKKHGEQFFTLREIESPLLIRYRTYLQITLWLELSSINQTLMSLKLSLAWVTNTQVTQCDPGRAVTHRSSSSLRGAREGDILWQRIEFFSC